MNNKDDFSLDTIDTMHDPDEERKPGSQREDASKWDQYTDAQRKLIAFGVLLAMILFLALALGIGSSCDSCGACRPSDPASGSDISEQGDRVTLPETNGDTVVLPPAIVSDSQSVPEEPVTGETEVSADDSAATSTEDGSEVTGNQPAAEVVSGSETSPADVSASDSFVDENGVEYIEVVQPGGFSACVHHADNEAGDGSSNGKTGFLGFLFGCSGCAEGCSLDVSEGLTDPVDGKDPSRQEGMNTSGSDADGSRWAAQPDDEAYLELLRTELAGISDMFIQLGGLDVALSQYTDPQRVRDNDRFRKLTDEMLLWCTAAESYDPSILVGEQAVACNQHSVQLAKDLRTYIDSYPELITNAVSGTDLPDRDDLINTVMSDIVALYGALNPAPAEDAAQ